MIKYKWKHILLFAGLSLMFFGCGGGSNSSSSSNDSYTPVPQTYLVEKSLNHITFLSENIGIRTAGSDEEALAKDYIVDKFEILGFAPSVQTFTYELADTIITSQNVIAVKSGQSPKEIIVGAHYDSVDISKGASDNASGIGLMLAIAELLKDYNVPYTIRFIAFGAEEIGIVGSDYYVSQMSDKEIQNTIGMINLDTVMGGDKIYVYGDFGDAGWLRDQCLVISDQINLGIETNPGYNPNYPFGTTGAWSDHAPFENIGIPYLYLEATNWEIGDLDGYEQTVDYGGIWDTKNDTLVFFNKEYPGRIESQLYAFSTLLEELLLTLEPPETADSNVYSQKFLYDQGKPYLKRDGTLF